MMAMDTAGLAVGIVGLAGLLATVGRECSNIFSEMKEIGYAHDSVLHNLRTKGLRLKRWEQGWGLDGTSIQQSQRLDPSDEWYRYAAAGLARIVAVFAKIAELQASLNPGVFNLLENPKILSNMNEEIACLTKVAQKQAALGKHRQSKV
ncbi:hypothetical protein BDZ91DRAFT_778056 [Kalaharituber pfeilii]|nr:hypothetical protein BDZ91DRAFT_778056 [Kalaharituber pfeilii]